MAVDLALLKSGWFFGRCIVLAFFYFFCTFSGLCMSQILGAHSQEKSDVLLICAICYTSLKKYKILFAFKLESGSHHVIFYIVPERNLNSLQPFNAQRGLIKEEGE